MEDLEKLYNKEVIINKSLKAENTFLKENLKELSVFIYMQDTVIYRITKLFFRVIRKIRWFCFRAFRKIKKIIKRSK